MEMVVVGIILMIKVTVLVVWFIHFGFVHMLHFFKLAVVSFSRGRVHIFSASLRLPLSVSCYKILLIRRRSFHEMVDSLFQNILLGLFLL